MKYVGSKNRISKDILPIMLDSRKGGQYWVEPFVGGANMIDKVDGLRIGNDINYYLIEMWKAIQNGWIPPDSISKNEYDDLRYNKEYRSPELVGFVGFNSSYGTKFFGGYARGKDAKGIYRNYTLEGKKIF